MTAARRPLIARLAACAICALWTVAAHSADECIEVKFDTGETLRIARAAVATYQAVLESPAPRIFAVDVNRPTASQLGSNCSLDAVRLKPIGQGPQPACRTLNSGKQACTYQIAKLGFAADVVMEPSCNAETVRDSVLSYLWREALAACNAGQASQSQRSNYRFLSDAYASALLRRASFSAPKPER